MKNSLDDGFNQHFNVQVAIDQASRLILGQSLSNHPNDKAEAEPTLASIPEQLGKIEAVAMDNGFFSPANTQACEGHGIQPYLATGPQTHHQRWQRLFAQGGGPPPDHGSPKVK